MAAEEHLVSIGWGISCSFSVHLQRKSQSLFTMQCRPLPSSAVQYSTVPLQRRSRWRQKYNFYFFHELFVCFALSGVYYCLFASKFVLYFSTVFSPLNFPDWTSRVLLFKNQSMTSTPLYFCQMLVCMCNWHWASATLQYLLKRILSAGFAKGQFAVLLHSDFRELGKRTWLTIFTYVWVFYQPHLWLADEIFVPWGCAYPISSVNWLSQFFIGRLIR